MFNMSNQHPSLCHTSLSRVWFEHRGLWLARPCRYVRKNHRLQAGSEASLYSGLTRWEKRQLGEVKVEHDSKYPRNGEMFLNDQNRTR